MTLLVPAILPLLLLLLQLTHARMSVMYGHDKMSDFIGKQCLKEMYPKGKSLALQESDEACIYFCVLRKFGIMTNSGAIHLDVYRLKVNPDQQMDSRNMVSDVGSKCKEKAESTPHKHDVCKKAKIFNDCTRLYKIMLYK